MARLAAGWCSDRAPPSRRAAGFHAVRRRQRADSRRACSQAQTRRGDRIRREIRGGDPLKARRVAAGRTAPAQCRSRPVAATVPDLTQRNAYLGISELPLRLLFVHPASQSWSSLCQCSAHRREGATAGSESACLRSAVRRLWLNHRCRALGRQQPGPTDEPHGRGLTPEPNPGLIKLWASALSGTAPALHYAQSTKL